MFRKSSIIVVLLFLLAAFGVSSSAQADATPTPDHLHMEDAPEGDHHDEELSEADHDHAHGERIDANGAAVKIISPAHNAVLDRDSVIVRVETSNWPLGEAGHHWHLYVNGKEQGMSQGSAAALQARDLQPGENIIEVTLSNALHQELNATDMIAVRYEASGASADSAAAPGLPSGVVITLGLVVLSVLAILGIGFAVTRKTAK
jgi:hypothetical protein